MTHKKASVILLIVLISFTCAQLDKKATTETPIDPTIPTATSVKPTEAPVTTSSSTTTEPTTTTSSTAAPTTIPPVTTTNTPSTTTPTPAPSPPAYGKWSYTDKNQNQTCVIVQLAVQLNFTYITADDKTSNVLYNVPLNETDGTTVTGSCEKDSQSITVQKGYTYKMMLQFKSNDSTSEFMLSEMYLSINASDIFKDAKANQNMELYHKNEEFATPLAMSYHCNKLQTLSFSNSKDGVSVANATISHVQLEAFHKQNNAQFATARDCEAIDTPDIVPIAVGCALAGLVVVVLIAYLVGRRRAQARGYLSM